MLGVIFLSFLVVNSMAQIPGTGPCKELKVTTNFNQQKFMGKWYAYEYSPIMLETKGRCEVSEFTENPDGSINCFMQQIPTDQIQLGRENMTLQLMNKNGNMTVIGPEYAAWYNFRFSIVSTDYVSYVVKGACENIGPSSLSAYCVLTRSRHPSQQVLAKIQQVLNDDGISQKYFKKMDQNNCPSDI